MQADARGCEARNSCSSVSRILREVPMNFIPCSFAVYLVRAQLLFLLWPAVIGLPREVFIGMAGFA